jgi:hypothetical protein
MNPIEGSPSTWSSGMNISWNEIPTVSEARCPILSSFFPTTYPSVPVGTMKAPIPLAPLRSPGWSVRTMATTTSPKPPLVTHALAPFSTHPPSALRACALMPAASEPESGSESEKAPSDSPRAMGFSQRSFCPGVPCARIICVGSELCTLMATATEASPRAISSSAIR